MSEAPMRKWDTMPTQSGWYWFRGFVEYQPYQGWEPTDPPEVNAAWREIPLFTMCRIIARYGRMDCEMDLEGYEHDEIYGTWYGPLTPPWEEVDNE